MLALIFLTTAMTMMEVTSAADSVQMVSFRKLRKSQNGPVMCVLETANSTVSPSSLQDCSLGCVHDGFCEGFNIKDSHTCDIYDYKPQTSFSLLVSNCMFYQVATTLQYFLESYTNLVAFRMPFRKLKSSSRLSCLSFSFFSLITVLVCLFSLRCDE